MEQNKKEYIVFIEFTEWDQSPSLDSSTQKFIKAKSWEDARKKLEKHYNMCIEYAKESGIYSEDEDQFNKYLSQHNGEYEIFADCQFTETGKIVELEEE